MRITVKIKKKKADAIVAMNISDIIVDEFLKHWTQIDYETKLHLWQTQSQFGIQSRLKRWKQNSDKDKPVKQKDPWL